MSPLRAAMVNEDEEYDDDDDEGEDQSMGADANLDNVEFEVNMNEYSNGKFDKQSSNDSEGNTLMADSEFVKLAKLLCHFVHSLQTIKTCHSMLNVHSAK